VAKKLLDVPQNSERKYNVIITCTVSGTDEDDVGGVLDFLAKDFPEFMENNSLVITGGTVEVNGD
jgi:hypothetical protein